MCKLVVSKSNQLIDASYKLNAQAQKLVLACLSRLDSRGEIPKEITLSALEFSELMCIDQKNAHRELYKAAEALFSAEIVLRYEGEVSRLRWVQKSVEKNKNGGGVILTWSDDVLKYISQLQSRFTSYKLRNIALLQSAHSIRLYELLMRFNSTGERSISVEDFKSALGISDKYPLFKDLNKRVIKPSIEELNARSDLTVTYETIKKGRSVAGLVFSFKQDNQLELDV